MTRTRQLDGGRATGRTAPDDDDVMIRSAMFWSGLRSRPGHRSIGP